VAILLAIALVAAQTCQKSQIRFNKNQAITTAEHQVGFTPQRTQVRLLRQGLNSKPFWVVSLSTPGSQRGTFHDLAVVKIDANTGKVKSVTQPQGSTKP
jgi:hypothetical protein